MQTMTPFLWFEGNVGQAMMFCTSTFKDSKVENVSRPGGPDAPVKKIEITGLQKAYDGQ